MKLSSLSLAVVLLISSSALAQHHDGSAPSTPPPPPVSVAPANPAQPPAPNPAPSPAPSAPSEPHNNISNAPPPSVPETRAAPAAQPARIEAERVTPSPKLSGEEKIAPAPRIGENEVNKNDAKRADPEFRRHICESGPCPQPLKSAPAEADLRRRPCPPGQTMGKGGCVANTNPESSCTPGMTWNGGACIADNACPAGQVRMGASCQSDCSGLNARAQSLIPQVRSARQQRDEACQQGQSSPLCQEAEGRYATITGEYRTSLGGAPAECLASLPLPETI
jgi:hypothetical protein